jgi:hypothetical protein
VVDDIGLLEVGAGAAEELSINWSMPTTRNAPSECPNTPSTNRGANPNKKRLTLGSFRLYLTDSSKKPLKFHVAPYFPVIPGECGMFDPQFIRSRRTDAAPLGRAERGPKRGAVNQVRFRFVLRFEEAIGRGTRSNRNSSTQSGPHDNQN